MSAANGQRPRNSLSCCSCSSRFGSFPILNVTKKFSDLKFSHLTSCSTDQNWVLQSQEINLCIDRSLKKDPTLTLATSSCQFGKYHGRVPRKFWVNQDGQIMSVSSGYSNLFDQAFNEPGSSLKAARVFTKHLYSLVVLQIFSVSKGPFWLLSNNVYQAIRKCFAGLYFYPGLMVLNFLFFILQVWNETEQVQFFDSVEWTRRILWKKFEEKKNSDWTHDCL